MKTFTSICFALFITTSLFSQINAPNLVCITTLFNGDVELTWEIPTNTCGTVFNGYRIYISNDPTQPFVLLNIVTNPNQTTFVHTNANGNSVTWYYYMTTDLICPNEVPEQSLTLANDAPDVTEIDYVTVNAAGNVEIHWFPNSAVKTDAYIILWETPTGFVPLDTVQGRFTTSYEHTGASPSTTQETYTIIAVDRCANNGLVNNDPQSTILLGTSIDRCTRAIELNWTPYQNWVQTVQAHQIWVTRNGGSPEFIDYISGDSTHYTFYDAQDGDHLAFQVYAVRSGSSTRSGSNVVNMNIDVVAPMDYAYLRNITVDADNQVQVEWRWDTNSDISTISIERADTALSFNAINTESAAFPLDEYNSFLDTTADASIQPLVYRISTVDSCDNGIASNIGSTLFLQGEPRSDFTNVLTWRSLQISGAIIQDYTIYKIIDGVETPIETIGFFETSYADALDGMNEDEGYNCYFIVARAEMEYPDGVVETIFSRSNIICVSQPPKLRVPNAFAPSGENAVFRPLIVFGEMASFRMVIFNRWGQKVFETTDAVKGWDGRSQGGKAVRQGVYIYYMSITKDDGTTSEQEGTVLLIR